MRIVQNVFAIMLVTVISSVGQNTYSSCVGGLFTPANQYHYSSSFIPEQRPAIGEMGDLFRDFVLHSSARRHDSLTVSKRDSLTRRVLWKPFNGPTLGVQTLATLGVGGIILGSTIGIASSIEQSKPTLNQLVGDQNAIYFLGSAVAAVLVPLTVYYSGKWMGGSGDNTWTFVGTLGGAGIGIALVGLPGAGTKEDILIITGVMAAVGGILGYHFSSSNVYEMNETIGEEGAFDAQQSVLPLHFRLMVVSIEL